MVDAPIVIITYFPFLRRLQVLTIHERESVHGAAGDVEIIRDCKVRECELTVRKV